MGSDNARLAAFQSDLYAVGIDLGRSIINSDPGVFVAANTSVFRAGSIVAMNASSEIIPCTGDITSLPAGVPLGIAKWNKATGHLGSQVDEQVTLNALVASNLAHGSIFPGAAGGVLVSSGAAGTGTIYTEGAGNDYIVNYTNGTIVRDAATTIVDGSTVFVTYLFTVAEQDLDFQGRNFFNMVDDVSVADGRITVITDWSLIFTVQYDHSLAYPIGTPLYCDQTTKAGLFTTVSAANRPYMGRVIQNPTATDPYLGVQFTGQAPAV